MDEEIVLHDQALDREQVRRGMARVAAIMGLAATVRGPTKPPREIPERPKFDVARGRVDLAQARAKRRRGR